MVRLLLILALVWHPLSIGFAGGALGVPTELCVVASCCEQARATACCDAVPDNHYCERSHGPCRCGFVPGDAPDRLPEAPLPRGASETQPYVAEHQTIRIVEVADSSLHSVASKVEPFVHLTHNEIQSLLCVWRT